MSRSLVFPDKIQPLIIVTSVIGRAVLRQKHEELDPELGERLNATGRAGRDMEVPDTMLCPENPQLSSNALAVPLKTNEQPNTSLCKSKRKAQEQESEKAESLPRPVLIVEETPTKKPKTTLIKGAATILIKTPCKLRGKKNKVDYSRAYNMSNNQYNNLSIQEELSFKEQKAVLKPITNNIIYYTY